MRKLAKTLWLSLALLALVNCGGGGTSGVGPVASPSPLISLTPTPTPTPTPTVSPNAISYGLSLDFNRTDQVGLDLIEVNVSTQGNGVDKAG
ncbi:MAG: hypothetical protein ACI9Y1_003693 [Lentisphaeria bacterium]|jgi:hypothetical protein